tara:strand:- start:895 stop:1629 length:735 start_codon:yes stop_codon:yes gene_type:complete
MNKTLILIPSRLSAKRLPNKPLLKLKGTSIISHVYKNALNTKIGEVYVATEDKEIQEDIINNNGKAILTGKDHKSGTDRIFEAFRKINLKGVDYILNLQGDEPILNSNDIVKLNEIVTKSNFDMGTLCCNLKNNTDLLNENIVKVRTEVTLNKDNSSRAIDFFRKSKNENITNLYHHLGIYIYKVKVLEKIVTLKQTINEKKNKLEQLRALENDINIHTILAQKCSIGVDTEEDYLRIKKIMEK